MATTKDLRFEVGGVTLPCTNGCEGGHLAYMSPEEKNRTRGRSMLYCPICSTKHFGENTALVAWAKDQKREARTAKARAARESA